MKILWVLLVLFYAISSMSGDHPFLLKPRWWTSSSPSSENVFVKNPELQRMSSLIMSLQNEIKQRDKVIQQNKVDLQQKDKVIQQNKVDLQQKDKVIKQKDEIIEDFECNKIIRIIVPCVNDLYIRISDEKLKKRMNDRDDFYVFLHNRLLNQPESEVKSCFHIYNLDINFTSGAVMILNASKPNVNDAPSQQNGRNCKQTINEKNSKNMEYIKHLPNMAIWTWFLGTLEELNILKNRSQWLLNEIEDPILRFWADVLKLMEKHSRGRLNYIYVAKLVCQLFWLANNDIDKLSTTKITALSEKTCLSINQEHFKTLKCCMVRHFKNSHNYYLTTLGRGSLPQDEMAFIVGASKCLPTVPSTTRNPVYDPLYALFDSETTTHMAIEEQ